MNPRFYQHFWDLVGGDVSSFVIKCLNTRVFPEKLNDTDVVLIPKKCVPETVADMRPIALSNVLYRIMAKMIANMMKSLMAKSVPHILSDLLVPEDVTRISRIPVSPDYEDSCYWFSDPKGIYTVKKAYRQVVGNIEYNPTNFGKWITLWKLKVPPKWKTFLWRAVCDILPTTTNLLMKRVEVDPVCPMCGLIHEDVMHTLISCDYSKIVWTISGLPVTNVITHSLPFWLTGILDMLTEEQCGLVVAVLYHVWAARNMAVWEGALPRPEQTWRRAATTYQAYCQVHHCSRQPVQQPTSLPGGLEARPRCFFNAGFNHQIGTATYGAVLVSHDGAFLAATNNHLATSHSPLMAEALACKEALSWIMARGVWQCCRSPTNLILAHSTNL
ncbi:PREDICTED: uncharacterized protein LOC109183338 [Ipomoea nil]|uniref:uncharacterized protein LOC109183338 n=1 Tax=Ipomoea nil TaxID=35883 RepID=UPI0009015726|nr:PREDICTED: uncharacterized protein LOC109183338 [Ipomoea nil]